MRASLLVIILAAGLAPAAEPKAVAVAFALQHAVGADLPDPAPAPGKGPRVAAALEAAAGCEHCDCASHNRRLDKLDQQMAEVLRRFSEPAPCPMPAAAAGLKDDLYYGQVKGVTLTGGPGGKALDGKPLVLRLDHVEVKTELGNVFACGPDCVLTLDGKPARPFDLLALPAGAGYRLTVASGAAVRCEFTTPRPVAAPPVMALPAAQPLIYAPVLGGCPGGMCGRPQ